MTKYLRIAFLLILLPFTSLCQEYVQVTSLGYTKDFDTKILEIDDAGNAYVIMRHYQPSWSSFLFPNGDADGNMVLAKLSSSGKLIWSKPLVADIYFVKTDHLQNVYVSGFGSNIKLDNGSTLPGGSFVLKLDKTGKSLWGVVSETNASAASSGPIAIAEDGIYWNASFYGTVHLQGRIINALESGSPESLVCKISGAGLITALYHDKTPSNINHMVEAENGNAAFIIVRQGTKKYRIIIDKKCNVLSETLSEEYPGYYGKITKTTTGYEMLGSRGVQGPNGLIDQGYYNTRFNKNLEVIESIKIFEPYQPMNPDPNGYQPYEGIGSQEEGFFIENVPKPYAIFYHREWLHLDQNYQLKKIANENSDDMIGDDPILRSYVKMTGDTLHMLIRHFSYYYGNSFTLNNQTYTTPDVDNFSWFWAKYVYKDPDSCRKIKAIITQHGKEGGQGAIIKLKLPTSCPASEDLTVRVSILDPSKNQNDITIPSQVIIRKGESSADLLIAVTDDNVMEDTESFTLLLTIDQNNSGYQIGGATSINPLFFVDDNDVQEELNISFPTEIIEGGAADIILSIPNGIVSPVDISFSLKQTTGEFDADRDIDFALPTIELPAYTNSIRIKLNALHDDLLEGDEFVIGSLSLNPNYFRDFKLSTETVNVKLSDVDNTYDNRVFYINPFLDTLHEGSSRTYTMELKSPLKLQRSISASLISEKTLPNYITQSATVLTNGPSGFKYTLNYLDDQIIGKEKFVVFSLNTSDQHTGDYRFWWKNEFSEVMLVNLLDNDSNFNGLNVPNSFSPNGDGVNDTWPLKSLQGVKTCTVTIFNRYGVVMFYSIGYDVPWDGKFKGADIPTGTYFYKVSLDDKVYSGNLNLIR